MLVWFGLASLVAAVVLALHHWYIHKDNVAEDMKGNPCLLQSKDFCVFTRGDPRDPHSVARGPRRGPAGGGGVRAGLSARVGVPSRAQTLASSSSCPSACLLPLSHSSASSASLSVVTRCSTKATPATTKELMPTR